MAGQTLSRLVSGRVMHRRHLPKQHRFVYPVFFVLLDIDELAELGSAVFGVNRWRPLAFHNADHGDGREPRVWIEDLLAHEGIRDCTASIWVQTFPRVFGFVFNPVSFWYCRRADGSTGAIVAEVNNTFGERHCYVLKADARSGRFDDVHAEKSLFVSPFYPLKGEYRFHFNTDFDAPRVSIDYFDEGRLQLNTAVWGKSRHLSPSSLLSALLRQPLLTLGVVARIHWQALRLWLKGARLADRQPSSAKEI